MTTKQTLLNVFRYRLNLVATKLSKHLTWFLQWTWNKKSTMKKKILETLVENSLNLKDNLKKIEPNGH
jgi:hypothetical protein